MRVLALDMGSKRIGVAVSDELGLTAQGLETIQSTNPDKDLKRILKLVEDYSVDEMVVGIPLNMNGTEGPQARKVREFADRIREIVTCPVREWDERLTTVAAERTLLEADVSRSKRRKVIDKLAAVIILQGYLDMQYRKDSFGS